MNKTITSPVTIFPAIYTFYLSKENILLAKAEFSAVFPDAVFLLAEKEKLVVKASLHFPLSLALTSKVVDGKGAIIFANTENWLKRRSHIFHGRAGISPKLARAMVNLAFPSPVIVDPFCGSGGILLETLLTGRHAIGYDIDEDALALAKQRIAAFGKHAELHQSNALSLAQKIESVVTDLPYGRSSKVSSLVLLYTNFLAKLPSILKGKAVIGFPHFVPSRALVEKAGFVILGHYQWYLHKSLTKDILVLKTA